MAEKSSVVVVDSRPLFRHGVATVLTSTRLFSIVGQGAKLEDAVSLVTQYAPRLIIVNIDLSSGGLKGVEQIKAANPCTRIILLSDEDDRGLVEEALVHAGVGGYLLSDVQASELCQAASAVTAGEMFVCQKVINRLFKNLSGKPLEILFSSRQEQILQLLCKGNSNKAIAFHLSISEKTVKHYLTTLMKKLGARNRVEVALFAAQRKASV